MVPSDKKRKPEIRVGGHYVLLPCHEFEQVLIFFLRGYFSHFSSFLLFLSLSLPRPPIPASPRSLLITTGKNSFSASV